MTGHDRLLDEIVKLSRRVAESERLNVTLAQTIIRRDARIESLERQVWDLAVDR